MVRLGAITILISLAIDPFSQQLVQLRQEVVYTNDAIASVKRAKRYSKGTEIFNGMTTAGATAYVDYAMHSAILYGLSHLEEDIVQQLDFSCHTGNYTREKPLESLAVCSRCADLSGVLERHNDMGALWVSLMRDDDAARADFGSRAYRLPNKLIIDNSNEWTFPDPANNAWNPGTMMTTFGTGDPAQSNSMQDSETLIWATSILKTQKRLNSTGGSLSWPDLPVQAIECGLYYCINGYETFVADGKLHEKTVMSMVMRDPDSWQALNQAWLTRCLGI